MGDFRKLRAWQEAMDFTVAVYRATDAFPPSERFGLRRQVRRAAASVAANRAEGGGQRGDAQLRAFVRIARGSAAELEYQLLVSRDLGYLVESEWRALDDLTQRVSRMLFGLLRRLEKGRGFGPPEPLA